MGLGWEMDAGGYSRNEKKKGIYSRLWKDVWDSSVERCVFEKERSHADRLNTKL